MSEIAFGPKSKPRSIEDIQDQIFGILERDPRFDVNFTLYIDWMHGGKSLLFRFVDLPSGRQVEQVKTELIEHDVSASIFVPGLPTQYVHDKQTAAMLCAIA
jgi:hypothetical protein